MWLGPMEPEGKDLVLPVSLESVEEHFVLSLMWNVDLSVPLCEV